MAEETPLGGEAKTPPADAKAISALTDKVKDTNSVLGKVEEAAKDTNSTLAKMAKDATKTEESIGSLLKTEREQLKKVTETGENIKKLADTAEKSRLSDEEKKQEALKAGAAGSGATPTAPAGGTGAAPGASAEEEKKKVKKTLIQHNEELTKSLEQIQKVFLTQKGLNKYMALGKANLQKSLMDFGLNSWRNYIGPSFAQGAGLFLGTMSTALPKFMSNMSMLFRPIQSIFRPAVNLITRFAEGSPLIAKLGNYYKSVATFVSQSGGSAVMTKMGNIFKSMSTFTSKVSGDYFIKFLKVSKGLFGPEATKGLIGAYRAITGGGNTFMKTFLVIKNLFGPKTAKIFTSAFRLGQAIGKMLPFLMIIPTAIQTVVAAFGMLAKGDFKGAFKAVVVGFLKGFAAFFTFGLSDLVLDFDKMFASLTKPLDNFISAFVDAFSGIMDVVNGVVYIFDGIYKDLIEPVIDSLYQDLIVPIGEALSTLGDAVMGVVGFVFNFAATILKPFGMAIKFVGKLVFEILKLLYDYLLGPLLKYLIGAPVMLIFKAVGGIFKGLAWIFSKIKWVFDWIAGLFDWMFASAEADSADMMTSIQKLFGGIRWVLDTILGGIKLFIMGWWNMFKMGLTLVGIITKFIIGGIVAGFGLWWKALKTGFSIIGSVITFIFDLIFRPMKALKTLQSVVSAGIEIFKGLKIILKEKMISLVKPVKSFFSFVGSIFKKLKKLVFGLSDPIFTPIKALFILIETIFTKAKEFILGLLPDWLVGGEKKEAPPVQEEPKPVAFQSAFSPSTILPYSDAGDDELQRLMTQKVKAGLFTGVLPEEQQSPEWRELNAERKRRDAMKAAGAGGGAPVVISNNSPTTNISGGGGGGGAIPVPLVPNPIRHSDPSRALIST